ncbi:hypothetical protein FO488_12760 [Geobacter sp. FeAm09]|uniref:hypothetical protein n=1 Tax=Geobacter sp. FeAm09 TaxID=2597769 RepID=UPI0011F004B3|nr:hypothetical protein [Geobacter sp. FeAm09]QEM68940.1 hypothetical protein FO488_12760 [Geobacter sp. FeAm09]
MQRTLCTLLLAGLLYTSPAGASEGVVLNFNEVDIATMVKFMGDLTGKTFVLDDRVKGKFSFTSTAKLSVDEAYEVFVSVLLLKNYAVIEIDDVVRIVPTADLLIVNEPIMAPEKTNK